MTVAFADGALAIRVFDQGDGYATRPPTANARSAISAAW